MRKIIGIGETILDIIFKDEQPTQATPGGSVFNGLITLGRLQKAGKGDYEVNFISDVGRDRVGNLICNFMEQNGVSSQWVNRHPSAKTAVSLAFLDENSDADYTFFKDYSYEGLQGEFPEITSDDLVIFGSYYALNPLLRGRMKIFLEKAKKAGALIYYDVNFRKSHTYEAGYLGPTLHENFRYANILRGSEDDFKALYEMKDPLHIYRQKISEHTKVFLYTAGAGSVVLQTPEHTYEYPVRKISPLSTVGAGDNFNAGILYGLLREGVRKEELLNLSKQRWDAIVHYALEFSSAVCQSYDNYISPDQAKALKH